MNQHRGFKLIMATSADGYVAKGPKDNMRWTGYTDKQVFRMLTASHPTLLLGRRTFEQMPPLPWRHLVCISRDPAVGITLETASEVFPGAWLGGGSELAIEALKAGLVDVTFLCHSTAMLGGGIPLKPLRDLLPTVPKHTVVMDLTSTIEIFHHHGP